MNKPSDSGVIPDISTTDAYRRRIADLEAQLAAAEETLEAIGKGEVDAIVLGADDEQRVFTLEGADRPYRLLIEQMREGAVTLSSDGTVLYCNKALADLLDIEPEHFVGRSFAPFLTAEGQPVFEQLLQLGGKAELAICTLRNEIVQVQLSINTFTDGANQTICGIVTDLTEAQAHTRDLGVARERLAVAAARRESDERFRLIVESATDYAIIATDLDARVTIWNPGAENILGWHAENIIGKPVPMIWTLEDRASGVPEREMATALRKGQAEDNRYHLKKDGSRFWANGLMMPLNAENGTCLGFLMILRDQSAQRDLEIVRAEMAESLERKVLERTAQLAATNDRLQVEMVARARSEEALYHAQKIEAIGQLTGGVAHDFNNLLTIIRSSTDLLRRPGVTEDRKRRFIDAISDTTDRASKLTSQLLAYARRQPLTPESIDVPERIEAAVDLLRSTVGPCVEVKTEFKSKSCIVIADANQLDTALLNLAVNARDAMKGEGVLSITVRVVNEIPADHGHDVVLGSFVAITVGDTGHGIPANRLDRIFEPFYTTKGVGKGTGLGLSQVIGFVKQSGGEVRVESEVNQGTAFTLYLPRSLTEVAMIGAAPTWEVEWSEDQHVGHILVVEDNADVGDLAAQLLRELGYTTVRAVDAADAMTHFAEGETYDLVFTDVVMPGSMSGLDLAQEIRRRFPDMPVVLTSGYSDALVDGDGHGFELLRKPYTAEALARVMGRLTRRGRS